MSANKTEKPDFKSFKRNEYGLLDTVNYSFDDNGYVNWRAMIDPKYLYPNPNWFKDKEIPLTIDGLPDEQLLIKLAGIRQIARLRGISKVEYPLSYYSPLGAVVSCRVTFVPNYETNMEPLVYEEVASVTSDNATNQMAFQYAETIACNRAFIRAVKNALGINILGDDEFKRDDVKRSIVSATGNVTNGPAETLKHIFKNIFKNDDFSFFKETMTKSSYPDKEKVASWNGYEDIQGEDASAIIGLIKKAKSK